MKKRDQNRGGGRAKTWFAVVACALVLMCGFFFAARQHFSSIDFGMKNGQLRKKVADLESEKRRLLLAREVSLSPAELKKAALKAKVAVTDAVTSEIAAVTTKDKQTTPSPATAALKTTASNPLITKTVATAATAAKPIAASLQKVGTKGQTIDKKFVARVTTATE